MKTKNYQVKICAVCNVVVMEAESEEKAMEYAHDSISTGDFEVIESEVLRVIPDADLANAKRHADAIATP